MKLFKFRGKQIVANTDGIARAEGHTSPDFFDMALRNVDSHAIVARDVMKPGDLQCIDTYNMFVIGYDMSEREKTFFQQELLVIESDNGSVFLSDDNELIGKARDILDGRNVLSDDAAKVVIGYTADGKAELLWEGTVDDDADARSTDLG